MQLMCCIQQKKGDTEQAQHPIPDGSCLFLAPANHFVYTPQSDNPYISAGAPYVTIETKFVSLILMAQL
jgi:hypothetical protein